MFTREKTDEVSIQSHEICYQRALTCFILQGEVAFVTGYQYIYMVGNIITRSLKGLENY